MREVGAEPELPGSQVESKLLMRKIKRGQSLSFTVGAIETYLTGAATTHLPTFFMAHAGKTMGCFAMSAFRPVDEQPRAENEGKAYRQS